MISDADAAPGKAPARYRLTVIARGLEVPWSMALAPDGRMFVTERPGRLRVLRDGKLVTQPLFTFPGVSTQSEEGLMGLALHPKFATNHLLYVSYASKSGDGLRVRVERYRENGETLLERKVILDNIPAAKYHAGCRLRFGPDGKLYITTGDATKGKIAQDLRSLGGKILRINDDGSVPEDNPFPGSPVFSLGHRNPQGIDWDPVSGLLFSTEHGPSGFDGGFGGDEVNIVERGKNYGWPEVHHDGKKEGMVSPLLQYTPAVAPGSAAFCRGKKIPELENNFFFGGLRGEQLRRIVLDSRDRRKVVSQEKLFTDLGRIRLVEMGADGSLYIGTSNRDGRGDPAQGDDRIFRVVR